VSGRTKPLSRRHRPPRGGSGRRQDGAAGRRPQPPTDVRDAQAWAAYRAALGRWETTERRVERVRSGLLSAWRWLPAAAAVWLWVAVR
jgi:hypothetical protein